MRKPIPCLPSPLVSLVFLLAFLGYLLCGIPVLGHPDTGWHLAAGDLIRATHTVPRVDTWSYFAGQAPWYDLSWAWDALISAVAAGGGLYGLYVFTALTAALVLALLAWTLKNRQQASDGYILLALLLVWYVLLAYLHPQPWLASFLLTVLFHHLLHRSREGGRRGLFIALPLLMLAWVNVHGGFLVGLSMIALYAVEAQQTKQYAWLKRLMISGFLCAAAVLVNPYGPQVVAAVLRTMHSVITMYLTEWYPLTFGNDVSLTVFLLLFIVAGNLRDPRVPIADKLLAIAWMIYALHTRRNFAIFALVAAPYFSFSLQETARYMQGAKYTEFHLPDGGGMRLKALALAVLGVCLLASPWARPLLVPAEKYADDPEHLRPAMAYIREHMPNARVANDYNLGGDLIYLSGGTWKVFGDGRAGTAYSEAALADMIAFATAGEDSQRVLDRYRMTGVLVMRTHPFALAHHGRSDTKWREVFTNDKLIVFQRK